MRYIRNTILVVALVAGCASGSLMAQSSSGNYALPSAGPVAGGGLSTSTNFAVCGQVPLGAAGVSGSVSYLATGGLSTTYPATAAFTAHFTGGNIQTVPVSDHVLKVAHEGGSGDVSGTIHYRDGGAQPYTTADMGTISGDTLAFTVGQNLLNVRGLEFYFSVTQDASTITIGNPAAPYVLVVEVNNSQGQCPTAMPDAQFRIVGVPLNCLSANASSVFLDDLGAADPTQWRLGSYSADADMVDEFPDCASVTPGQGYWLIARGAKTYGSAGTTVRPNRTEGGQPYYEISLDSGWNQLGNPFPFNIHFPDILMEVNGVVVGGHPDTVMEDFAYWYNGSAYNSVNWIPGWSGAFVYIKRSGVAALFPYEESNAFVAKPLYLPDDASGGDSWEISLRLEAGGLSDDGNLAGVHPDALDGEDCFDLSEPPPAPGAPSLAFSLPEGDPRARRADYRPPFDEGGQWNISISPASGRMLTAAGIDRIPPDMEAYLVLDNNGQVLLAESKTIPLPDDVRSARLLVGVKEYLDTEMPKSLPDRFALGQNRPNPFNPKTSISFALPEASPVTLEVFNILGQRIRVLLDENLQAGEYSVEWDGRDDQGLAAASGIYFYRLTAGSFAQCRKMVLLK